MHALSRAAVAAVGVAALPLLLAPPARAVACPRLSLAQVDQTRLPEVVVRATLATPAADRGKDPQFRVLSAGRPVPVAVTRPAVQDLAVAVVVTTGPQPDPDAFVRARTAVRELLVTLPAGARVALVGGLPSPRVLAPLSTDRTLAGRALADLLEQPQTAQQAVQAVDLGVAEVAAADWPTVLVVQPPGPLVVPSAATGGVAVRTVVGGPQDGCAPDPSSVVAAVDQAVTDLGADYRLRFSTADPAATVVEAVGDGTVSAPLLPQLPRRATGGDDPSRRPALLAAAAAALALLLLVGALSLRSRRRSLAPAGPEPLGQVEPAGAPAATGWRGAVAGGGLAPVAPRRPSGSSRLGGASEPSTEMAARAFDAAPGPTLLVRHDGAVLAANQAARALLGLPTDRSRWPAHDGLVAPQDRAAAGAALAQVLAGSAVEPQELTWVDASGTEHHVHVRYGAVTDSPPYAVVLALPGT